MSEDAKEKEILHYLYEKWVNEPHKPTTMTELIQKGVLEGEKDWYTKIEIMISKGLIASHFPKDAIITAYGIERSEDARLSPDIKIRSDILKILKNEFDKNPLNFLPTDVLDKSLNKSGLEIERNLQYLREKNLVETRSYLGLSRIAKVKITPKGIEFLKTPTQLEHETEYMSNAYKNLYRLENELRIFIETKLKEKYKNEWWETGVPLQIRRKTKNNKSAEPESTLSWINYTEFSDLRKIIIKDGNWDIFSLIFKSRSKVEKLDELEKIRHSIAHTRLLDKKEFDKLNLYYKEFHEMMGITS